MKILLICFLVLKLLFLNSFAADTISGSVEFKGKPISGTLYIFAKKFNAKMPMPLAVKKIENPKFPVQFTLGQADAMIKGMPFKGPFKVTARLSPSGGVMDKSGVEMTTNEAVKLGDDKIKLILESK